MPTLATGQPSRCFPRQAPIDPAATAKGRKDACHAFRDALCMWQPSPAGTPFRLLASTTGLAFVSYCIVDSTHNQWERITQSQGQHMTILQTSFACSVAGDNERKKWRRGRHWTATPIAQLFIGQLVEVCCNSNASSSQTFSELFLGSDGRRWTAAHIGSGYASRICPVPRRSTSIPIRGQLVFLSLQLILTAIANVL